MKSNHKPEYLPVMQTQFIREKATSIYDREVRQTRGLLIFMGIIAVALLVYGLFL